MRTVSQEKMAIVKSTAPALEKAVIAFTIFYQSKKEKQKAIECFKKVVELATIKEQNWSDAARKRIEKA